jgi:putative oxidoreductase
VNQGKLPDVALLIMRLGLGLILLYYGLQKMFGLFGGAGFQGTVSNMGSNFGIPPVFAILAICAEFFGSIGLIVGFLTRIASFGLMCTMAVATFQGMQRPGMWSGLWAGDRAAPAAILYPLALFVFALGITLLGPGAYSLDSKFFGRKSR